MISCYHICYHGVKQILCTRSFCNASLLQLICFTTVVISFHCLPFTKHSRILIIPTIYKSILVAFFKFQCFNYTDLFQYAFAHTTLEAVSVYMPVSNENIITCSNLHVIPRKLIQIIKQKIKETSALFL